MIALILDLLDLFNAKESEIAQVMLDNDVLFMAMSLLSATKDLAVMERILVFVDNMCKFVECCEFVVQGQGIPVLLQVFRFLQRLSGLELALSVLMSITQYPKLFDLYPVDEVVSTVQVCMNNHLEEPHLLFECMVTLGNLAVARSMAEMLVARGVVATLLTTLDNQGEHKEVMLGASFLLRALR